MFEGWLAHLLGVLLMIEMIKQCVMQDIEIKDPKIVLYICWTLNVTSSLKTSQ